MDAVALLMAPLTLAITADTGLALSLRDVVALAASTAFMTPVSSPVNTLVVGPGNDTSGDFVKVGVSLSVVALLEPLLLPVR